MAPRVQWSVELVTDEFIVPRLEDHLIDELFYQEDEIGEMRHTAFMVECGLEEDPPDGPDVPPVPWGDMLLKQQQEEQQKQQQKSIAADKNPIFGDDDSDSDSEDGLGPLRPKRELPNRSRSTDDIDTLAIELTATTSQRTKKKTPPKRCNSSPVEIFVVDGQSSQNPYSQFAPSSPGNGAAGRTENRRPPRRAPTKVSPESPPKRKTPVRGGLTKTRSGTTHEMASAAARARKKLNQEKNGKNDDGPKYRKLTKTTSGTCREMANAAAKARKKLEAEKAKKKAESSDLPVSSPSVSERRKSIESKDVEKKGRPAPLVRGLVATKSGTKHKKIKNRKESSNDSDDEDGGSPKIVYKNGKRTAARRSSTLSKESRSKSRSNASSTASDLGNEKKKENVVYRNGKRESIKSTKTYNSFSASDNSSIDDDFLGDIVQESDDDSIGRSDISISTCEDESAELLVPKSIKSPLKIPVRQRSLSTKDGVSDDNLSDDLSPKTYTFDLNDIGKKKKKKKSLSDDSSLHSTKSSKSTKSLKKKKKKNRENGGDDSSVHSTKSLKRRLRKKKDKEALDNSTKDDSIYSPRQTSKKQSEIIYGSPSSIRSQNRPCFNKKSPRLEPMKDDSSKPSIINIGSPGFYGSPSATKSRSLGKRYEPQSPSPSISSRPDDFLVTDPLAAIKAKKEKERSGLSSPRPGEWLGSGSKAKRTWRVKSKPAEN